tara:strand:+ start:1393 stop:1569 length:177 start_codon:yes stop_codon:yes gene_type:complete
MLKKSFIIILSTITCWSIISLTSDAGMKFYEGVVTVDTDEITINNSKDIEEYIIGVKP